MPGGMWAMTQTCSWAARAAVSWARSQAICSRGGVVAGGAAAVGVFPGLEDVLEDDEASVADGRGEGDGVVAEVRELVEDGRAVGGGEDVGGEAGGGGVEEVAVGVFAIVVAAGVVVAEGEVDGGVGKGLAELESDEGDGLGGEGGVLGVRWRGG